MASVVMLILTIIGGTLLALISNEVWAWIPSLNHRLVRKAANRFKDPELRERYREEWQAAIDDIPGSLTALVHALSLGRSVEPAEQAWRTEMARGEVEERFALLDARVERFAASMLAARTRAGVSLLDIANITNVHPRVLEALEKGELLTLPWGRAIFHYLNDSHVRSLFGDDFELLAKQFAELYSPIDGGLPPPRRTPSEGDLPAAPCRFDGHVLRRRYLHRDGCQFHWHYVECELCGKASTMKSELCYGSKVRRKTHVDQPVRELYTCELPNELNHLYWPQLSLDDPGTRYYPR